MFKHCVWKFKILAPYNSGFKCYAYCFGCIHNLQYNLQEKKKFLNRKATKVLVYLKNLVLLLSLSCNLVYHFVGMTFRRQRLSAQNQDRIEIEIFIISALRWGNNFWKLIFLCQIWVQALNAMEKCTEL